MDDAAARKEATQLGLIVAGTLAILDQADRASMLHFDEAVAQLRETSFRVSEGILADFRNKRAR